jgi:hypothetical protein
VLDELNVDDPVVEKTIALLARAVTREAGYYADRRANRDFPVLNGPLFLIGGSAVFHATWAITGDDRLPPVLALLERHLSTALASYGFPASLTGTVVAAALLGALSKDYRFEASGDVDCLKAIHAEDAAGNALETLIRDGVITPEESLRVGLAVLAALTDLCRTDAASVAAARG